MPETESAATRATRRAIETYERVVERLKRDLMTPLPGMRRVSGRMVMALWRRAQAGDEWAMSELMRLGEENGHVDGEPTPCPVCRVIKENSNGER